MTRCTLISFLLLIPVLPTALPAAGGTHWLEGEVLSRKTLTPDHHHTQTRYVYHIRGGGMQYTARFDHPLSVGLYEPLKFAVSRRHLVVQDTDGSELKASILRKSEPVIRR